MMTQVVCVVAYQILERRSLGGAHCIERDLVEVMFLSRLRQNFRRYNREHVREMKIVRAPELDKVGP